LKSSGQSEPPHRFFQFTELASIGMLNHPDNTLVPHPLSITRHQCFLTPEVGFSEMTLCAKQVGLLEATS